MMNGRLSGSVKNLKVGKAKTSGKACCDFDLISADDSTEVSLKYYGDSGAYLIKNCEDGDFVTISYALECRKNDSNRYELNLLCQGVEQSITDSQEEINEGFMRGYLKYAPDFNKRTETLTMWISTPSIGLDGFPRTYECKKTKEQRKDFTLIPLDITDSKIIKAIKKANLDKDDELSIYYTLESDKDGSLRIEVTDVKIIRRDSDNKEYPKGKGKKSSKNTTKNKSESYSEEDLENMDKSELREVAKELGISYSRTDNEDTLIDKILEHLESDEEDDDLIDNKSKSNKSKSSSKRTNKSSEDTGKKRVPNFVKKR